MLLITFLQDAYVNTTVLPDKKTGHYKIRHSIPDLTEDIIIDGINQRWIISSGEQYQIADDAGNLLPRAEIGDEDVLTLMVSGMKCTLIIEPIRDEKNRFIKFCAGKFAEQDYTIRIGSQPDNDIVLDDLYISGEHAVISRQNDCWYVEDCRSRNGTYINNRKIAPHTRTQLSVGDVVFLVGYKFVICADFIAANIQFERAVRADWLIPVRFPEFVRPVENKNTEPMQYFYRTIDLGETKPDLHEIELLPPEHRIKTDQPSILLSMGSAISMSTATVLIAGYSAVAAYFRHTNFSYVVPSFIMAGSMVLSSLVWPTVIKKQTAKHNAAEEEKRVKDYQEYIMQLRDSVSVMKDQEKEYLCKKNLGLDACMARVLSRDRLLWSKSIGDEDFLRVVLGVGNLESAVQVKFTENSDAFFKDDLRYDMMQFVSEDRIIENVPITVSLNGGCICGISGSRERAFELLRSMVVQLTALYSYDELKLIFIYDESDADEMDYVRWLPHVWNADNTFRYIACTEDDLKELTHELEKELDNRTTHKEDDFPKILVIATDKKKLESIDILPVLMRQRETLGISLMTAFGMYNYSNSDMIVELSDEGSKLYDRVNSRVTNFESYHVTQDFEPYLHAISNIRLDISTEKNQLPKMLTFLDMFHVSNVQHLNSPMRWQENNPIKSLKTEIGVAPSGDIFCIDMHEKYHGPHGLIAGTTGSGKSESIITIILSLAVNYSPEEVAFVIVDYKGGGLADAFNDVREEIIDGRTVEVQHKLPHIVGTVTNLDGATIERACISIETELKRRQRLFKKARRLSDEGTMDIYKYQQLRRQGADLESLPHLFIVCDEFAELKADRTDFMDLLVSAARIGRSLGIHLILATQKPDSVVSPQIWSNSRFKICLKVQEKEDSRAVIHCPDAAEISTTGRFYFQVGYNEVFSMAQSAWCGADYIESDGFVRNDIGTVEVIGNTGTAVYEKSRKPVIRADEGQHVVSQLVAVREYLIESAKDMEIRPLWLEPIPAKLSLRELYAEAAAHPVSGLVPLEPIIGKRDDLYNRIQEIMKISFSENGNLIAFGAAGSGLDMFFISLIYSLIYGYRAEQVNLYIIDFDAGFLKAFQDAPHVGDVVTTEQDSDAVTVIEALRREIVRRSKLFSAYRGEYTEYCRHSGAEPLPRIVLMLNNYTEFAEKCGDAVGNTLMYIAREGIKRGVYLVIGTAAININYRLRQYIQQTFMFRMNDTSDYASILGRTGGITPSECPGSGIVKEEDITYKFQVADIFDIIPRDEDDENPAEQDAGKEIKMLCKAACERSGTFRAVSYLLATAAADPQEPAAPSATRQPDPAVPALPDAPFSAANIPLGTVNGRNYCYDFSDKYLSFVSAAAPAPLAAFAQYLADRLSADESVQVAVLDVSGALKKEDSRYVCYSTAEELAEWNRLYKAEAERRCGLLKKNPDGTYSMQSDEPPVYVIIPFFQNTCAADRTNVTILNLKSIVTQLPEIHYHYIILDTPEMMNGTRGAYFHLIKDLDDITDLSQFDVEKHREWFDASGIWLGEGLSDSGFFTLNGTAPVMSERDGAVIRNCNAETVFRRFRS